MILQFINFVRRLAEPLRAERFSASPLLDSSRGNGIPLPENDFGLWIMNRPQASVFSCDSTTWGEGLGTSE